MNQEKRQHERIALLEAILFTTDEPLSENELMKILKIKDAEELLKLISILKERYSKPDYGIRISDMGGYKLIAKEQFLDKVSHLTPHADLSRGLLRVLSIIAYHEPVVQSEIVKIIGNRTYEYVKELEGRGLIKSEKKSRTKILRTTPHFEEYFGSKKHLIKKEFENEKPGQEQQK